MSIYALGLRFTIMDFAGLFGKIIANVTAIFDDFLPQLSQLGKRRPEGLRLFRRHPRAPALSRGLTSRRQT